MNTPNRQPLPLVLKVWLLGLLGCSLAFLLGGIVVHAWALTLFGAVLTALVVLGAWKMGA